MQLKQKLTVFGFSFLIVILILFSTLTFFYFYIPFYVKSKFIPEMAHKAGIRTYAGDVRRIGFFGADFGSIRIGDDKHPALSIASVQIDYSPKGLYRKAIRRTVLSGIELFCEYKNGKFRIRNFDLEDVADKLQSFKNTTRSNTDNRRTVSIEHLKIQNAVVVFEFKERTLRLPLELEIISGKKDQGTSDGNGLEGILRLYPRGQEIVLAANIQMIKKQILLRMDSSAVHLERFTDFTNLIPGLILSGNVDINGEASFQLEPLKISSASAALQFHDAEIAYNNFLLKNVQNTQKQKRPLKVEIKKMGEKEWRIFGTPISAVSPLPFQASDMNCQLKFSEDAVTVSGNLNIALEQFDDNQIIFVKMLKPLAIKGNYFATLEKNGKWQFRLNHTPEDTSLTAWEALKFNTHGFDIVSNLPIIDISGKGEQEKGLVTYNLVARSVKAASKSGHIQIPSVSLKGEARFNNSSRKKRGFATFKLKAPGTGLTMASTTIKIPTVLLTGELWKEKDHALNLDSLFKFEISSLTHSGLKTKVEGINGIIPLKWPLKKTGKEGKYFVKQLSWKGRNLGSIKGTVQQKGAGFIFKGAHKNNIIQDLSLNFTGNAGVSSQNGYEAGIHFQTGHYKTSADIDLGQFYASAKGVTFNGEVGVEGDIFLNRAGITSPMRIRLKNANVTHKEKDTKIEGIQLALYLTDLFKMKSAPKQLLRFDKASLGGLNFRSGMIEFQVESVRSFFIENSSFSWCDGVVYSPAIRISPGTKDYHIILYCDRLNLPMILEQLGAVRAEGIGTVNGRLPIQVKNGKIRFSDGFLYSTPGEGGKIHVTGTEMLTAGIPPDTPQYVQLELAREALKDYDYNWAKLNLKTEGDDAVLLLRLDGKPSNPLPFVYNKEIGGFAKVEAGIKGSIFQGIRLDVNFRVPLDKILHYKDILDMIK